MTGKSAEILKQMTDLQRKKTTTLEKLVQPARAAANQMKDAKMDRGADPVLEVLFELDSVEQEMVSLVNSDPTALVNALKEALLERPPGEEA